MSTGCQQGVNRVLTVLTAQGVTKVKGTGCQQC